MNLTDLCEGEEDLKEEISNTTSEIERLKEELENAQQRHEMLQQKLSTSYQRKKKGSFEPIGSNKNFGRRGKQFKKRSKLGQVRLKMLIPPQVESV